MLSVLLAPTQRSAFSSQRSTSSRASIAAQPIRQGGRGLPSAVRVPTRVVAAAETASTAKIIVQGRNISVSEPLKEYAINKVSKAVHNFEGSVKEVDVRLSVRGKNGKNTEAHHQRDQIVEVTVFTLRHGVVRVEDEEQDIYAAVDLVTDKLKRKLAKLKEKAIQKSTWPGRGGSKGAVSLQEALPEEVQDRLPTDQVATLPAEIVREKLLFLSPMSPEEAVDQLENVGHDFFVFTDAKDSAMKIVYKRRTHGYGIIVPQQQ